MNWWVGADILQPFIDVDVGTKCRIFPCSIYITDLLLTCWQCISPQTGFLLFSAFFYLRSHVSYFSCLPLKGRSYIETIVFYCNIKMLIIAITCAFSLELFNFVIRPQLGKRKHVWQLWLC